MKLNKILMALSAMAIVGCSSEDFNDPSATQAIDDSRLIQLDENFVLAGVGVEGSTTRTHWVKTDEGLVNKFLPIWKSDATFKGTIDQNAVLEAQAVGLCWLGQNPGAEVYTNYQFYHFGWLNNDKTKAEFNCGDLENGSLYSEITVQKGTVDQEAVPGTDWKDTDIPEKSWTKDKKDNLNYNSGIYKTDNKAIFGGQYIVYYPYNANFKDAGTIPATAVTEFGDVAKSTNAPTALTDSELGRATFRYSAPVKIEGGNQAADFTLKNLSALVQLRVAAPKGYKGDATFDKIVLYSEKKQLLKQANLAADKIAAGNEGTELYTETEGTKTIVANLPKALTLFDTEAKDGDKTKVVSAYITALPTTVEDLVVFVHSNKLEKWAKVSLPNTVFKAGSAKRLDINVAEADFKADFIAVDEASLRQALNDAEKIADKDKPQTIQVIGDITLESATFDINAPKDAFITIKGDDIIVPEDKTLTLNTNMESNVRVLGKSCCSKVKFGGRLYVEGGKLGNVTMEKTEAKTVNEDTNPMVTFQINAAEIVAGKTFDVQAGNVVVNVAVAHKGDIQIAKGATVTVNGDNGDLQFMGSNVTNNGTIEVKANGNFDMTDAKGNATAADGKRMTNNGTFIHNVDAGVGTAVQSMVQNGEYRCRVDKQIKLDDAYQQWTACSVIEMVNTDAQTYNLGVAKANIDYKHNGKYIDIEVNSDATTTFDNTIGTKKGDGEVIMIGNLTVKKGGLDINFVSDNGETGAKQVWYRRTLTVNGDMTVAATTNMNSSKKINITKNLIVSKGQKLTYAGNKANVEGLAVTNDIKVSGTFDASAVNALNITCANFTLSKPGIAYFGNRTDGAAKNMVVSGTIDNPDGCEFDIYAAEGGNVLAWVSCKELKVGGKFPHSRPRVVE